jgi:hypothetical protein
MAGDGRFGLSGKRKRRDLSVTQEVSEIFIS